MKVFISQDYSILTFSLVTWMRYIGKHAKCDGFEVNEWKWLFEMDCFTMALSRLVVTADEV